LGIGPELMGIKVWAFGRVYGFGAA